MWHDSDRRLSKAVERFEEGELRVARTMLRNLDRRGVISPRIDLYLGHCHLESDQLRAAIRRYRRCVSLSPASAAPWIGLGLCYGRLGYLARATRAFLKAQELDDELEEAHCNLVHCFALQADIRSAEKHARRVVELDPTCPHVFRHLAVGYLVVGRPSQALSAWEQVRLRADDHPELPVGLARVYAALDRPADARNWYLKALDGGFRTDAHYGLGELARREGRWADAAEHYREAAEGDPEYVEARTRWAESLNELGRPDGARDVLAPLFEDWPPEPEVVALGARVHIANGDRRAGLALLRRLLQTHPRRASSWRVVGETLLELGRPVRAARALRRALRLDPDDIRNARVLARSLGRSGRRREAVSVLARAARRHPEEPELHLDVAAAQLAEGRPEAAERGLLRGLSWNPEVPSLWAAAAELALEQGKLGLARARLRSALRRNRRHPQALSLLVQWLFQTGQTLRAVNAGRAAARVLPEDDPALRDYGRALVRCGRAREAMLPLRRYVLAAPDDPRGYEALARAHEAVGELGSAQRQRRLADVVGRQTARV